MREALIVSTARTPIARAFRGAFNALPAPSLAAHAIRAAVERAGIVFAVPKLLARFGLKIQNIGLWELNEAFAVQVLYCRDCLGIPDELMNVNGGAIAIGHPYGMSGTRMVGHALIEGKRRGAKYVRRGDYVRWGRNGHCGTV